VIRSVESFAVRRPVFLRVISWVGLAIANAAAPCAEPFRLPLPDRAIAVLVAFSPDGKWLAVSSQQGRDVLIWDASTRKQVASLAGVREPQAGQATRDSWLRRLVFAPDGRLAAGTRYGITRLWDARQGWNAAAATGVEIAPAEDACNSLAFAGRDNTLVAGMAQGPRRQAEVQFWDISSRTRQKTMQTEYSGTTVARLSRDEKWMTTITGLTKTGFELRLWNLKNDASLLLASDRFLCADHAFSPDGAWLAVGRSTAPSVVLWDLKTRQVRARLQPPSGTGAWSLAFSPDGKYLAAGVVWGNDAWMWDLAGVTPTSKSRGYTNNP